MSAWCDYIHWQQGSPHPTRFGTFATNAVSLKSIGRAEPLAVIVKVFLAAAVCVPQRIPSLIFAFAFVKVSLCKHLSSHCYAFQVHTLASMGNSSSSAPQEEQAAAPPAPYVPPPPKARKEPKLLYHVRSALTVSSWFCSFSTGHPIISVSRFINLNFFLLT